MAEASPNQNHNAQPAPPAQPTSKQSSSQKSKLEGYTSEGVKDNDIFELPSSDWQLLALLTVVGAAIRLFRIYQPTSVVFDEVHFGGFASKYIKGKFFMDVHPPLAKLLITVAGWIAGFDGNFDFKDIGKDYLEPGVPYVAMRMVPAICGILTIPTMFLTLKAMGCKTMTAALGAGMLMFENGLITQSRFILLDSPLIIFTALTVLAWTSFMNQHELGPKYAFTPRWWFWLAATGLCLGATVSVKWVGLFTIGWVGSLTILQLWMLLGDTKTVTPKLWARHFSARAICLIGIPLAFYMFMFAIHFVCLVNPGEGDGFMSSEFQSTLNSKGMRDVPADVAFGSRITLRHHNTQGGYLHSHLHMYPTGSKQQQITLYPHKDENNVWILENQTIPEIDPKPSGPKAWDELEPEKIKNGDVIRLYHTTTNRRLHSHDHRPPVTEADWQQEVTAYGYEGFEGDANDYFRVEIIKSLSDGEKAKNYLRTIQSKFRLVHIMSGCVLFSHKVKLPAWGFEQQEVTCAKGATLPNSIWYIESNIHPKLGADAEMVNYAKPGFFGKFWELQRVMWRTNAGLVESHAWDSRPPSWPVLRRGINFWGKEHRQIYLMGNPVVWYSSTAAIVIYLIFKGIAVLRWQRSCGDYNHVTFKRFDFEIGSTVLGWAFHYFPFFLMARQLFLHHYFPALYFAVIAVCQMYDFFFTRIDALGLPRRPVIGQGALAVYLALSIVAFTIYSPLVYGDKWTQSECKKVKLLSTWDWDCNTFHTSYDQYDITTTADSSIPASAAPAAAVNNEDKAEGEKVTPSSDAQAGEAKPLADHPPAPLPPPPVDMPVAREVRREERVEFRDAQGNLLNAEQVEALKGKVSFETKYETRTRIVDAQGREIYEGPAEPVAPPHPDVEGANPETPLAAPPRNGGDEAEGKGKGEQQPPVPLREADPETDVEKERRAERDERLARPGSEGSEATGSG